MRGVVFQCWGYAWCVCVSCLFVCLFVCSLFVGFIVACRFCGYVVVWLVGCGGGVVSVTLGASTRISPDVARVKLSLPNRQTYRQYNIHLHVHEHVHRYKYKNMHPSYHESSRTHTRWEGLDWCDASVSWNVSCAVMLCHVVCLYVPVCYRMLLTHTHNTKKRPMNTHVPITDSAQQLSGNFLPYSKNRPPGKKKVQDVS